MARKVFYSFHYVPDNWRAAQVRNIWAVEWNKPASDNDREEVKNDEMNQYKNGLMTVSNDVPVLSF